MGSEKGVYGVVWGLGARGGLRRAGLPVVTDRDQVRDEIGTRPTGWEVGHWGRGGVEGLAGSFHWTPADRGWRKGGYF